MSRLISLGEPIKSMYFDLMDNLKESDILSSICLMSDVDTIHTFDFRVDDTTYPGMYQHGVRGLRYSANLSMLCEQTFDTFASTMDISLLVDVYFFDDELNIEINNSLCSLIIVSNDFDIQVFDTGVFPIYSIEADLTGLEKITISLFYVPNSDLDSGASNANNRFQETLANTGKALKSFSLRNLETATDCLHNIDWKKLSSGCDYNLYLDAFKLLANCNTTYIQILHLIYRIKKCRNIKVWLLCNNTKGNIVMWYYIMVKGGAVFKMHYFTLFLCVLKLTDVYTVTDEYTRCDRFHDLATNSHFDDFYTRLNCGPLRVFERKGNKLEEYGKPVDEYLDSLGIQV